MITSQRLAHEITFRGDAPVAANNLAFIYAERGQNLDVALQLAMTAKQRMTEDSNVEDTLWAGSTTGADSRNRRFRTCTPEAPA